MIDQHVFKNAWTLLSERFNRDPSNALMMAYYRSLSPRMDTETFQRAARVVFDTAEFWPKPGDFIDAVDAGTEASALSQWEVCQRLMRGDDVLGSMDPEGRRVVRLLGGTRKLRNTKLDEVPFVRRDFLALYGEAADIARREGQKLIEPTEEGLHITRQLMDGAKDKAS